MSQVHCINESRKGKHLTEVERYKIETLLQEKMSPVEIAKRLGRHRRTENIRRYKTSTLERVKLHEVAEVFRGKSILKKDVKPGKIMVLNISNITDTGIDYSNMDNVRRRILHSAIYRKAARGND